MLAREAFRKVAAFGHDTLFPDSEFLYNRLFKKQYGAPGKSYLSLVWTKMLQTHGVVSNDDNTSLREVLPQVQDYLKQIPHPMGRTSWNFFIDPTNDLEDLTPFWQAISDPELSFLWNNTDSLGWLFQYLLRPGLDVFRSHSAPKIQDKDLALRTQQFTPQWIADFLVQNTLGQLWIQLHPDSQLVQHWPYLVLGTGDRLTSRLLLANQIKILDPACGTMHLGLAAIKAMIRIYREELQNAGKRGWPERPSVEDETEIPSAILENNLFGIEIDPLALELAALTLSFLVVDKPNKSLHLLQANSLKKDLTARLRKASFPETFDVILLNPPYLDKRDYNLQVKAYMAKYFKESGRNLYTAFLERSQSLLTPGGRLGAITPQTFMFIRSFDAFRKKLLNNIAVETLVHTGLNTFKEAVVDCAFYVLRREDAPEVRHRAVAQYFQLTAPPTPQEKQQLLLDRIDKINKHPDQLHPQVFTYRQTDFNALPGSPWVYWIGANIRRLFHDLPVLGQIAELRQGLATTDNRRFLRYWWEIPSSRIARDCRNLDEAQKSEKKWFPYLKGGGYRKWYGMQYYLVNWEHDGQEIKDEIVRRYPYLKGCWQWVAKNTEYYFREGVNYSYLTSGSFSARYSPPGFIFDVAGSSIFADEPIQILGILNSRFCRFALSLINHTVNFQVGDLQRLPVPKESSLYLKELVQDAIKYTCNLETFDEISPHFVSPAPWPDGCEIVTDFFQHLCTIQRQVDEEVYRLYNLTDQDQQLIEQYTGPDNSPPSFTRQQLAHQWIDYAVGIALGRYQPGEVMASLPPLDSPFCPLLSDDKLGLAARVKQILIILLGPENAQKVIHNVTGTDQLNPWLRREFFDHHFRHYFHRPVYWLLKRRQKLFAVYTQNLNADNITEFLPARKTAICFDFDDGILANMKKLKSYLAIPAWQRRLK